MWRRIIIFAIFAFSRAALAQDTDPERMFTHALDEYREAAETGNPDRIIDSLRVVLDVAQHALPPDDERLPIAWMNYGNALADTGAFEEAEELREYALELAQEIYGEDSEAMVPILMAYADTRARHGKSDDQESYYREALKIIGREHGEDSLAYARTSQRAGSRVLELSGTTGGRRFLEDAYEIFVHELGAESFDAANAAHYLGTIERQRRRYARAIHYFLLALDGMAGDTRRQNAVRTQLVSLLEQVGDTEGAREQLLEIAASRTPEDMENNPPIHRAPVADPRSWNNRVRLETVDLEFTVDADGFVRNPVVLASSGGEIFEQPARQSVSEWRFVPTLVEGRPVATENVRARVRFPPREGARLPRGTGSDDLSLESIYRQQ
jgi:TonB family protein